jgi:hypothetical protein
MPILGALFAWLLILGLAVANGALREAVLIPSMGRTGGLVLSGLLLSLLVALVAYAFVRAKNGLTVSQGLLVGIFWLCLTLVFEFGFGRYVQHKPWDDLIEAYTFKDGNIWPVVLLVTLLAPSVAARLRAGSRQDTRDRAASLQSLRK